MSNYAMALILQGNELDFPVLPEEIKINSPGKNEKMIVLKLGEINRLQLKGLKSISFKSFFPVYSGPYVTGQLRSPIDAVRSIQRARDRKKPVDFLIVGTDLDINMSVGIESFEYSEKAGEVGDIYYSIELSEWKEYSPQRLNAENRADGSLRFYAAPPKRAGEPINQSRYHTVRENESIWHIAQRAKGVGSEYQSIYKLNQGVIGSHPDDLRAGERLRLK